MKADTLAKMMSTAADGDARTQTGEWCQCGGDAEVWGYCDAQRRPVVGSEVGAHGKECRERSRGSRVVAGRHRPGNCNCSAPRTSGMPLVRTSLLFKPQVARNLLSIVQQVQHCATTMYWNGHLRGLLVVSEVE